jgi:hypothetical protein
MDKRLYFELMVELSHKDTWMHYYFVCYKTFVIFSFFFFLPMIPSLILYKLKLPEFNFTFNERTIPITNSHKHLGVTFSSDAKWNIHVENILLSIYKHLNVLRKLKSSKYWKTSSDSSSLKLQMVKLIRIPYPTIIPYFTSIFKNIM